MGFYVYVYLDSRKQGDYIYNDLQFDYEPIYIGKGKNDRIFTHINRAKSILENKSINKNSILINKLISILNDGKEPIIFKIYDNISEEEANTKEINLIKLIGKKKEKKRTLLNIADGGTGGITWVGDNPFKGKKLEEICGKDRASELKKHLSELAKDPNLLIHQIY